MTVDDPAGGAPDVAATAIGAWLEALGSRAPAPGGGAAAAMCACVGAALVEMVCNLTIGKPAFAGHEQQVTAIREQAAQLRAEALGLMGEDAAALRALIATYRLPRDTGEQRAARAAQIQAATLRAASVPLRIAAAAAEVTRLAGELPGRSNPGVLSDVAVAAAAAAAAVEAAAVNVEINLAALKPREAGAEIARQLGGYLAAAAQAHVLAERLRQEISR